MTEKRFTYENHKVKDNLTGEFHSSNRVSVNVLNSLNDENEQLKTERLTWLKSQEEFECLSEENKELKEKLSEQGVQLDFLVAENIHVGEVINENIELQGRNNRQAQIIDELWSLIVANDWTKLKEMVEEDKNNEELLHREFKCYEGDNDD